MSGIDYIRTVKPGTGGIDDAFLNRYVGMVGDRMLPYQWKMINDDEKSGIIHDFRVAAGEISGDHIGMVFQDEGLFKWLEAAAYYLADHPDPTIREWVEYASGLASKAQQDDGYLLTYFMLKCPELRFHNLLESHELVCMGNILEAGTALHRACGDDTLLAAAVKLADLLCEYFREDGPAGKIVPGHPGLEMCLVKLYRTTGQEKYLQLAKHFLDVRGLDPEVLEKQFRAEWGRPHIFPAWDSFADHTYMQIHAPVREQTTAEGHAVRAGYLYSGMADVYMETGDESLFKACETIYRNLTLRRMYITGGVGSSECGERFAGDYDLPNDTVYAESCASVALAMFSRRMFQCTGDGKYLDTAERALYNTVLASVALDGEHYFYVNPLEVWPDSCEKNPSKRHVKPVRQGWYQVACCPQNTLRTLAGFREYICYTKKDTFYIGLFVAGEFSADLEGQTVRISVKTAYPFEDRVDFTVKSKGVFTLAIRDPGWSEKTKVLVNGAAADMKKEKGMVFLARAWNDGDTVSLILDMEAKLMTAHPRIRADAGKAALMKGPLVYCFEEADNGPDLSSLSLRADIPVREVYEPDLLGGTLTMKAAGRRITENGWEPEELYRPYTGAERTEETELTAIPYCLWNNRAPGEMSVWMKLDNCAR